MGPGPVTGRTGQRGKQSPAAKPAGDTREPRSRPVVRGANHKKAETYR